MSNVQGFIIGGQTVLYDYDNLADKPTIDSALSGSSTNPVQNKAVADAVNEINNTLSVVYSGNPSDTIHKNMELGNISINTNGWSYSNSTTRVRTKQGYTIHLDKGDVIGLTSYTNAIFYLGWKLSDNSYDRKGWNSADYTVQTPGEYVVCLRYDPEVTITSESTAINLLFVKKASLSDVNEATQAIEGYSQLTENLIKSEDEVSGYLNNSGGITDATANKETTSGYISVTGGEVLFFMVGMKADFWSVACFYNSSKQLVGARYYFSGDNEDAYVVSGYKTKRTWLVAPSGAAFVRVSYRTLNGCFRFLARESAGTMALVNASPFRKGNTHIKSIAHRGFEKPYPENTKLSFWGAVKAGFDACETDLRFTSDSIPVCLHNESINGTARNADGTSISGTVNIASITYEAALAYDFGYNKSAIFAGQKIPTFGEYLKICKYGGLEAYVEVKAGTDAQLKIATDLVIAYGMVDKTTFICDNTTTLAKIATNLPTARLGYIVATITSTTVSDILALKTDNNEVFANANYSNLTDSTVALCVDADLPLEAWTVNSIANIVALDPYVTGVTSGEVVASDALANSITW